MYDVRKLHTAARAVFELGTEWNADGIDHKHNVDPTKPRSPFKFHVATSTTRPRKDPTEPRLPQESVDLIAELLLERLRNMRCSARDPLEGLAITSVPAVCEAIANAVQNAALRIYGVHIPHIRLLKEGEGHDRRITG